MAIKAILEKKIAILLEIDPNTSNENATIDRGFWMSATVNSNNSSLIQLLIYFIQSDLPRSSSCIQFTEKRSLEDFYRLKGPVASRK